MIKVLVAFGTRPEALKMMPVVRELHARPELFDCRICVTGQHRELLDQVLDLYEVSPHHDLDIMESDQSLTDVTIRVLRGLESVLEEERPDWVLVQGDTTTAMAASLAGFYRRIPVAHVEAGLRTYDPDHPFPEEINRRITGVVSDLHFAPTDSAADNLAKEGTPADRIVMTGNTIIDAVREVGALPFHPRDSELREIATEGRPLVLVTAHRRENFGLRMSAIAGSLRRLIDENPHAQLVCPLHPNPHAHGPLVAALETAPNATLVDAVDYQTLIWLLRHSHLLITDSGGLQEEATSFALPTLVLRETTERPEGVQAGLAQLVGADPDLIFESAHRLLNDEHAHSRMAHATNPYGQGDAAIRIADALQRRTRVRRGVALDRGLIGSR